MPMRDSSLRSRRNSSVRYFRYCKRECHQDFVGSGSITLESGVGITTYRRILDIKGVGSASFSGSGVIRSSFDPPEGTYLHIFGDGYSDFKAPLLLSLRKALRLVGELTHPDIDFTPHYGIDRNIGIETACSSCLVVTSTKTEQVQHCYHKVLT